MAHWTWLHPWLLTGLLAAVLPILIHLIGRKLAPKIRFSAFDFLMRINKRLARRERLRQFLILLFRVLLLVAITFAIARPIFRVLSSNMESGQQSSVLLIDSSASMAYQWQGQSLLDHAQMRALEIIQKGQAQDSFLLVWAGEENTVPLSTFSMDRVSLRQALEIQVTPNSSLDLQTSIQKLQAVLPVGQSSPNLFLIGDLAQNTYSAISNLTWDRFANIKLVDAIQRDPISALPNLAITHVTAEESSHLFLERLLEVDIRNYGEKPVRDCALEIYIDHNMTQRGFFSADAFEQITKRFTYTFSEPGVHYGEVRLLPCENDGFSVDNQSYFVLHVAFGVDVMAVNGDPRDILYEDELFFVENALANIPLGDPPIRLVMINPLQLDTMTLEEPDQQSGVTLIANVHTLKANYIQRLSQKIKEGHGLFIGLGAEVDFEIFNEQFRDVLPKPLRDRFQVTTQDNPHPMLGIGKIDFDHPLFKNWQTEVEESLRASNTSAYFNLDVNKQARIIMAFENGAPALVEYKYGAGKILLWSTTLDLAWSDIALRSSFPAILQRSIRYLAGESLQRENSSIRVGSRKSFSLGPDIVAIALIDQSQKRQIYPRVDIMSSKTPLLIPEIQYAGFYNVEIQKQNWQRAPHLDFAVNISMTESDFRPTGLPNEWHGNTITATYSKSNWQLMAEDNENPLLSRGAGSYLLMIFVLIFICESILAFRG